VYTIPLIWLSFFSTGRDVQQSWSDHAFTTGIIPCQVR
jgi:hypothetical protein